MVKAISDVIIVAKIHKKYWLRRAIAPVNEFVPINWEVLTEEISINMILVTPIQLMFRVECKFSHELTLRLQIRSGKFFVLFQMYTSHPTEKFCFHSILRQLSSNQMTSGHRLKRFRLKSVGGKKSHMMRESAPIVKNY